MRKKGIYFNGERGKTEEENSTFGRKKGCQNPKVTQNGGQFAISIIFSFFKILPPLDIIFQNLEWRATVQLVSPR